MSNFIEFQALVLEKLTRIDERLSNIEATLGINCESEQDIPSDDSEAFGDDNSLVHNQSLKSEFDNFQNELADIKSLFSSSDF